MARVELEKPSARTTRAGERTAKQNENAGEDEDREPTSNNSRSNSKPRQPPPLSTSVKRLSEDNPTARTYMPKEIFEWLDLQDKDQIAWQRDERSGKHIAIIWKRE